MSKFIKFLTENEKQTAKFIFGFIIILFIVVVSPLGYYGALASRNSTVQFGYGYLNNWYGYGIGYSSALPSAPTGLACSKDSSTSSTVNCYWNQVTTAIDGSALDNFSSYKLYYATTSGNANRTSGTAVTAITPATTLTTSITGLTSGTEYYFTVYTYDTQNNYSAASALAAATPGSSGSTSGGGGGGSSSTTTVVPAIPATPAVPGVSPAIPATPAVVFNPSDAKSLADDMGVARDTKGEAANAIKVAADAKEFGVTITAEQKIAMANFVTYGISDATEKLGSGERRALLRDYLQTIGRANVIWADVERMATGQKPVNRNLAKEQAQVGAVLARFKAIVGHTPNFQNAAEDLAWNTMMYRIRFDRNLNLERSGITEFKKLYGRIPTSPLDWSVVRAAGYVLGK